jgi:hypothetical protein
VNVARNEKYTNLQLYNSNYDCINIVAHASKVRVIELFVKLALDKPNAMH